MMPAGMQVPNTGSAEWHTPSVYVDAARRVMGGIDLDPFSSDAAQRRVCAGRYYTAEQDAFRQDWTASSIWMNPPYSAAVIGRAVNMLIDTYLDGKVPVAIALVNNSTETRWFQRALSQATLACFPRGRIRFHAPDGTVGTQNTRGQAFLMFGGGDTDTLDRFAQEFRPFGSVVRLSGLVRA